MADADISRRTFVTLAPVAPATLALGSMASAEATPAGPEALAGAGRAASPRGIGAATARSLARWLRRDRDLSHQP